ncbi:hypothetical protein M422DRAFT_26047 [Sphaerobolus stellatus SS14]|nr:hypothetical protein M422DRAFT_26047 [Sphaerobolus stellatus SS14]
MGLDRSRKGGRGILGMLRNLGTSQSTTVKDIGPDTCSSGSEQFSEPCPSPISLSSASSTSGSSSQRSSETLVEHGYAIQTKLDAITTKLKRLDDVEFGILLTDIVEETLIFRRYVWPSNYEHILDSLFSMSGGVSSTEGSIGRRKLLSLSIGDFVDLARGLLIERESRKTQLVESIHSPLPKRRTYEATFTGDMPFTKEPISFLSPRFTKSQSLGHIPDIKERQVEYPSKEWEPFSKESPYCLDGNITEMSQHVVTCGGYSDIWSGRLEGSKQLVAIKVIRGFSGGGDPVMRSKMTKRIWREYLAWSSLRHPNILPCLGFSFDFSVEWQSGIPALISPWMENGTLLSYIQSNPQADRMSLIVGITQGLLYLHVRCPSVIHGDIRAGNILMSDEGIPRFSDFGLSRVHDEGIGLTTSSEAAGSLRWMAPELFSDVKVSVESDVWAYGMTLLEIATCKRPYADITADPAVLRLIIEAELPCRPNPNEAPLLTEEIWQICGECWKNMPEYRPTMQQIASKVITKERYQEWKNTISEASSGRSRAKRVASEPIHVSSKKNPRKSPIIWRKSTRTHPSSLWEF